MLKKIEISIENLFEAIEKFENESIEYEKEFKPLTPLYTLDELGKKVRIKSLVKKNKLSRKMTFSGGVSLGCANKHWISFNKKECIFAEDLLVGDSIILSDNSSVKLVSYETLGHQDVYDFEIDSPTHLYQTSNRIIHHNTTLATYFGAQIQKQGGTVAYVDVEHAFDPSYARDLGFNIEEAIFAQPTSGEQALDIVEDIAESGDVDLIVLDSVAALVPKAELEGEMGDQQMGLQARLMGKACRKLTGILGKTQTTVMFINQVRMKIGCVSPETKITWR